MLHQSWLFFYLVLLIMTANQLLTTSIYFVTHLILLGIFIFVGGLVSEVFTLFFFFGGGGGLC